MKRIAKYLLPLAMWCCVAAYIVWAWHLFRSGYSAASVSRVEIEIADSTADRRLVTAEMVREWLSRSGVGIEERTLDEIDLQKIERIIAANGFVGKVSAYTAVDGVLRIEVRQRLPLLRLLTDGCNRYVTDDGFVFGTPSSSAVYVPVVTGSYRPQFPADFEGYASDYCTHLIEDEGGLMQKIAELRSGKNDIAEQNRAMRAEIDKWKKVRTKIHFWNSKITREAKTRKEVERDREIARLRGEIARNEARMARVDAQIEAERRAIKKTREKYEDFDKLLTFVKQLERDSFWQSEIVQIVADRSSSGLLELKLVPRSGPFIIEFGDLAHTEAKLNKLKRFYDKGLTKLGWNEYASVSVAYKGQVVCKRRK